MNRLVGDDREARGTDRPHRPRHAPGARRARRRIVEDRRDQPGRGGVSADAALPARSGPLGLRALVQEPGSDLLVVGAQIRGCRDFLRAAARPSTDHDSLTVEALQPSDPVSAASISDLLTRTNEYRARLRQAAAFADDRGRRLEPTHAVGSPHVVERSGRGALDPPGGPVL